ncbi:MAG: LysR family transcriptional regulator [Janthinobacterium lividum]
MRPMELRDLQALSALVKLGTTRNAALGIGVSQPTISRAVMHIEAHFGKQLFTRHNGRLLPTADALRISESVEKIAGVLDFLQDDIRREDKTRSLRVAVTGGVSPQLLRLAILRFVAIQPAISVSIRQMDHATLSQRLAKGEIDVGLSVISEKGKDLCAELLVSTTLCCVLPRRHALSRRSCIEVEQLRGETLIGISDQSEASRLVRDVLRDVSSSTYPSFEVSCAYLACQLVAGGLGIGIVPEHPELLRHWDDEIQVRPLHPAIVSKLYAVTQRTGRMQQVIEQFCGLIRKAGAGAEMQVLQ